MEQNSESGGSSSIIDLLDPISFPVENGYRLARELSRSNELHNPFLDRSRWLESFHKNIL
jgi:hypothetical protein